MNYKELKWMFILLKMYDMWFWAMKNCDQDIAFFKKENIVLKFYCLECVLFEDLNT